ncbi:MAG: signal peptidase II [Nitrosomonadales bacterium]
MLRVICICFIVGFDQYTKYIVSQKIPFADSITITNFFDIVHFNNTGAAFSFLHNASGWQNSFFIFITIFIILFLVYQLRQLKNIFPQLSILFIIAGGIGNLIDRVFLGHVIDFLYFHINDLYWPAFNIADSFITIGAIGYGISIFKGYVK